MITILLSIKPEFAVEIFSGNKRFEFRKCIFKQPVTRVVVYASAPVGMIIGEFEVDELVYDDLDNLWHRTRDYAGISEEYFYSYFGGKNKGYAIKVKNPHAYKTPRPLKELYNSPPPQSFVYLINFDPLSTAQTIQR